MYNGKFDTPSRRGKVAVSGNTVYCNISNFEKYANYRAFWCYSNDHGNNNASSNSQSKYSSGYYEVTASALRVRTGPSTDYRIVTRVYNGSMQLIDYTNGNWGHLSNNTGWICLDYCKKIDNPSSITISNYQPGEYITTSNLHVRFGPSTNYRIKTYKQLTSNARAQNKRLGNYYYNGYRKGVECTVYKISGNWGLTKSGWICLDYCRKVK